MSEGDIAARELGAFLRVRREGLPPSPNGVRGRRRTPGLRREEVAERAGVSTDYVVRLEQGRGVHPSPEVLAALASALQLSDDERVYVTDLARSRTFVDHRSRTDDRGQVGRPEPPATPSPTARLVHDLSPLPAMLLDHRLDILAWNAEMSALLLDLDARPAPRRNAIELCLFDERLDAFYPDHDQVLREGVADLRAAWAIRPDDARLGERIASWCARSPEFARLWELRDVRVNGRGVKRMQHPTVGPLTIAFEVLNPISDPDERLVIYRAADHASQRALDRLGAPDLAAATASGGA